MTSKRETALLELRDRLAWITVKHGFNSDAGENISMGEVITLGPDDPPAALSIAVGQDSPTVDGGVVRSSIPVEVQAFVPADIDAPIVALERLIADIKVAVEVEGNGQNAAIDPSVDRALSGTLPLGLTRASTRPIPREEGASVVGVSVGYLLAIEERWGQP
jgi:hypothetical protein